MISATRPRVVIVGGGITGLSVAESVERSLPHADVVLLEARPEVGGNLQTERVAGHTVDLGPDSWVAQKPQATELARRLGLGDELMGTNPASRQVFVVRGGRLVAIPAGFLLGVPTQLQPLLRSDLFSWRAKLRLLVEPLVPRRRIAGDETVGAFVGRRLGAELKEVVAAPLLGGIFAGNVDELSLAASFPQLSDAERDHGSLIVAMRARERARRPGSSAFVALRAGIQSLPLALAASLQHTRIERGANVTAIVRIAAAGNTGCYAVQAANHVHHADYVFIAGPATQARALLAPLSARVAAALSGFTYASAATVFFAFRATEVGHPLKGLGFIVPAGERRGVLAGTWVSSKWSGRAAPGEVLLRLFVGGAADESVVVRDDAELVALAARELARLMGIVATPLWTRVARFLGASPQPRVGHLDRVVSARAVLAEELPGIYALGSGYDGTGISDCVRQADTAVRAMRTELQSARDT
jgi:protoporphyrinogen/coproporphyrinogen III oxidase